MKKSGPMSVIKYFTMIALGVVLAIGVLGAPRIDVKAKTFNNVEYDYIENWDSETGTLTLTGNIVNEVDTNSGNIKLPDEIQRNNVKKITTSGTTKLPSQSQFMFEKFSNLEKVDMRNVDTSEVINMKYMFSECTKLNGIWITAWNTSQVTCMNGMFYGCSSLTELDISGFTSINQIVDDNFESMFQNCSNLRTIYVNNSWALNENARGTNMFSGATKLVGGNGTLYDPNKINAEYARIDLPESGDTKATPGYFTTTNNLLVYGQLSTNGGPLIFTITFQTRIPGHENTYSVLYDDVLLDSFVISCDGYSYMSESVKISVPAKEMNVSKNLVIKKGDEVLFNKSISIADYLRSINYTATKGTPLYNVTGAMLRYGAAAIKYFYPKTETSNLPNNGIEDYDSFNFTPDFTGYDDTNTKIDPIIINIDGNKFTYAGIALSLDKELNLMMAYKIPDGVSIENWDSYAKKTQFESTLTTYITDDYKSKTTFRLDGTGKYVLAITDVNILDLEKTIYTGSGQDGFGTNISAGTYLYLNYKNSTDENLKNVCKTMYAFHLEALEYKKSTSNNN